MPGTLTITTLSDGTNSTSATNCIQGSAKAWVSFVGSTAAVNASYNVSSVVRNSTGNYTVNFTSAFVDTKYAAIQGNNYSAVGYVPQILAMTTGSCTLASYNTVGAANDPTSVMAAFFR